MKTLLPVILFGFLFANAGFGQEKAASPSSSSLSPAALKALEGLKQKFNSLEEFEKAAKAAQDAGAPQRTVDEIRLIIYLRNRDLDQLPAVLSRLDGSAKDWKDSESVAFDSKTDLEAMMFFGKSLLAAKNGNAAEFEQDVKEAFWRDPALSDVLGEEIKKFRLHDKLATTVLPLDLKLESASGKATSLRELVQGQKAVLLDFWASWCGPCLQSLPEVMKRAQTLSPQKVVVVGINTEASEKGGFEAAKKKAADEQKKRKIEFAWLLEPADMPFSRALAIDSIPRMVLVSPEGKVLYDGHPDDPDLISALQKIGVKL